MLVSLAFDSQHERERYKVCIEEVWLEGGVMSLQGSFQACYKHPMLFATSKYKSRLIAHVSIDMPVSGGQESDTSAKNCIQPGCLTHVC